MDVTHQNVRTADGDDDSHQTSLILAWAGRPKNRHKIHKILDRRRRSKCGLEKNCQDQQGVDECNIRGHPLLVPQDELSRLWAAHGVVKDNTHFGISGGSNHIAGKDCTEAANSSVDAAISETAAHRCSFSFRPTLLWLLPWRTVQGESWRTTKFQKHLLFGKLNFPSGSQIDDPYNVA